MHMEKGKKYIHYCWFGDKKLSKLAKKCIKSWKKYLPDYEIVCWNEKNVDLDECPFVREAYDKKKWAFVADYVRAKAIYEYGGIYLDTDMKIIKKIDFLLKKDNFIGVEDSGAIAVGVWGANKPGSLLAEKLVDFYKSQKHFNVGNLYSFTIPVVVTNILTKYGFKKGKSETQVLNKNIYIYPREYFYPLSYNYHNNAFTKETCMIHYYDASWAPKTERRTIWLIRKFGPKGAEVLLKVIEKVKAMVIYYLKVLWRTIQIIIYPFRLIYKRLIKRKKNKYKNIIKFVAEIQKPYVVFVRENWLGVGSSTISMFGDAVYIPDVDDDQYKQLVETIIKNKKIKMVIFSGFAKGWERIIQEIKTKKPEIVVKIFWHGSNAMHIENFDWDRFNVMFSLLEEGFINEVAFAKKSMYEQYKKIGYNVSFLPNTFTMDLESRKKIMQKKNNKNIRIGIYSSGDRWVKNFYNQVAATSLIKDAEVDVVPMSPRVTQFAKLLRINLFGEENKVSREELFSRIAEDDIVLYATFVECAPILPLECLELGVPCITGDNHHYWVGTELEKYLVEPKVDNPVAIAKRIEDCIENKDEIIKLYKDWKKKYDKYCEEEIKNFLRF